MRFQLTCKQHLGRRPWNSSHDDRDQDNKYRKEVKQHVRTFLRRQLLYPQNFFLELYMLFFPLSPTFRRYLLGSLTYDGHWLLPDWVQFNRFVRRVCVVLLRKNHRVGSASQQDARINDTVSFSFIYAVLEPKAKRNGAQKNYEMNNKLSE